MQLNDGDVFVSTDDTTVYYLSDAPSGGAVSKSTAISAHLPVASGGGFEMRFEFLIPTGDPVSDVYIADFEANGATGDGSSQPQSPGIRVYLDAGIVKVDRGKIAQSTWTGTNTAVVAGRWYSMLVDCVSGEASTGAITVALDDTGVLSETGETVLTQAAWVGVGGDGTISGTDHDRVQVGMTANDGSVEAGIAIRNLVITRKENATDTTGTDYTFDPEDLRTQVNRAVSTFDRGGLT